MTNSELIQVESFILEEGIDWESITGPATLFPTEVTLKVVK